MHPVQHLKTLTTMAALAVLLALGAAPAAQAQATAGPADSCDRIQGTIQVDDDAPDRKALAQITAEQAGEAAVAALAGATIQDIDLEEEDGYLVYEVDLIRNGEEHDAYVDAGSGAVLCMERDD